MLLGEQPGDAVDEKGVPLLLVQPQSGSASEAGHVRACSVGSEVDPGTAAHSYGGVA
jgi:hypothetical protein